MKKSLVVVVAAMVFTAFAELSAEPCTCHWTGDAKNGNWWDVGNWAEGVVPGVYTALDADGNLTTNGCRGCTAVFGRVANNSLDSRRCIHANPYAFNADVADCLLSIGHIVFDGTVDPEHPDYVLPEYVFTQNLNWSWSEPYLPLEGGGSVELKETVDRPVYFDTSLVLGARETKAQTYRFINNSPTTVAFHRLTAMIGSVQWSKDTGNWLSNTIKCEGTGDIVLMSSGSIPRSNQEYSWRLAMTGGRLLVRKSYNLGTKAYANVAAQSFQLIVPAGVGPQVLDIEESCSFAICCDNSSIADISSDLKVTGAGKFIVHSGTSANREFYVSGGATVEIAGTITNNTAGTFAGEKAGLCLKSNGGGTFFVSGTNAIPGAVQIGPGITYIASTIGNVGEFKELGAGQRVQFDGGGVLKYTGAGEYSTKFIKQTGYAGDVWNAGTGDLFFAGLQGNWNDYKITLTNDGVHAVGLTGDVLKARPIVAPGSLVRFAPPEGEETAAIDVTNMMVSANSTLAIADGTSVRIHALYKNSGDSTSVNVLLDEGSGARVVIDNLGGFGAPPEPGAAPSWIRVNGRPARFGESFELIGIERDDLTIAARGDTVPDEPMQTVAITSPGEGGKDVLAADETKVFLLRNRETSVTPVIELGTGQTLTAPYIECADGATPIVFTGAGALASPFNLLDGTVVRSNETAGVALAVTAADSDVTLDGCPDPASASFAVAVERGAATVGTSGMYPLGSLNIGNGAAVTLEGSPFTVTSALNVGQKGSGTLVIGDGTIVTGLVKVAGVANSIGMLVQNGGEIHVTNGAFQVCARDGGYAVFHQKAGLLWQRTPGEDLYTSSAGNNGSAAWIIDGPNAISRVWIKDGGRNFVLGGSHTSTTDRNCEYVLAVNDGGMIHSGTIVATKGHTAKTRALVNFNGGVFRNNYAYGRVFGEPGGTWFDPVDRVTLFEKGMTMQADVDCTTVVPLDAPTGKGVASIAWTDTETEFAGSPAVRISGAGYGATAVAVYDSTTRKVTGIRVTSPGCDYGDGTVAEVLCGNGGAAAKVIATIPCALKDNVSGGFTKTGIARFGFATTNTYTGATVIETGTLRLDCDNCISPKSELVLNGGILDLNGKRQMFSNVRCNGGKVENGTVDVSGLRVDFNEVLAGNPAKVDLSFCRLPPKIKPDFVNFDPSRLDTKVKYLLIEFKNALVPEDIDFSGLFLPKGWTLKVDSLGRVRLVHGRGFIILIDGHPKPAPVETGIRVSEFGYDPEDATQYLEEAVKSSYPKIIVDRRDGPWYAQPLRFSNIRDKEIVFEDGAELCAKRGSFVNPYTSCLLSFTHCTNITLRGKGLLRMWRSDYFRREYPYENDPVNSQHRHTLNFSSCAQVTVEDLTFTEAGGDGLNIGAAQQTYGLPTTDVTVRNVTCTRNFRQGFTVDSVENLLVEDSRFELTGEGLGTDPMAGIDIEPSTSSGVYANCLIRNCVFNGNAGSGLDIFLDPLTKAHSKDISITIEDCDIYANAVDKSGHYQTRVCEPAGGVLYGPKGFVEFKDVRVQEYDGTRKTLNLRRTFGAEEGVTYPETLDDYDFSSATVVDTCPGESVALDGGKIMGGKARVTFYAAAAGAVNIVCRQEKGWQQPLATEKMRLENAAGGFVSDVDFPGEQATVLPIAVPAAGFYSIVANTGHSSLIFTASDVPLAYDNRLQPPNERGYWQRSWFFRRQSGVMGGSLWFPVRADASGLAFAMCSISSFGSAESLVGNGPHVILTDPTGSTAWDKDDQGKSESFLAPNPVRTGLWNIRFTNPEATPSRTYYMFAFDLAGVPPFFFLSKDKYWK